MSNALHKEQSPYLKQHSENPVNWFPWTDNILKKAEQDNKAIFLSIGYSTCYWCHVMEKECFEDEEVAAALNSDFISIKVDREERPDIDSIYMESVIAMSGHGGWPMSVFLTPDRKPFYAATYIPKPHFLQVLDQIKNIWENSPDKVISTAEEITAHLRAKLSVTEAKTKIDTKSVTENAIAKLHESFDSENGGFGFSPKFPPHSSLQFLLQHAHEPRAYEILETTLTQMAKGGIFDHVDGGFHRYSVDQEWTIPHFEKMLYDNAQLLKTYSLAAKILGNTAYQKVAENIFSYTEKQLRLSGTAHFAAMDAGPVNEEGLYYGYTLKELEEILDAEEIKSLSGVYDISPKGNFEHDLNILRIQEGKTLESKESLTLILEKLSKARTQRERVALDTKRIVSWNGLQIEALNIFGLLTHNEHALSAAKESADYIIQHLFLDGILYRSHTQGHPNVRACSDDYCFLIAGLLEQYQNSFDAEYLHFAFELQKNLDRLFWDEDSGVYFFDDGEDTSLITRKHEITDNATPCTNGYQLKNLLTWYFLTAENSYLEKYIDIRSRSLQIVEKYPSAGASYLTAFDQEQFLTVFTRSKEDSISLKKHIFSHGNPPSFVSIPDESVNLPIFREKGNALRTSNILICIGSQCLEPCDSLDQAVSILENM